MQKGGDSRNHIIQHVREHSVFSIRALRQNPILILPDFVLFLLTYFLTIAFYRASGANDLMKLMMADGNVTEIAKGITSGDLVQFLTSLGIFVFVTFFLGVGIEAVRFGMIKQIIEGKKASLISSWKRQSLYFWKIVSMKVLIYLLVVVALLGIGLLSVLTYSAGPGISSFSLGWVTIVVAFVLFVFFTLGLLFRYAIMFLDGTGAKESIKLSFSYLKSNTKQVFFVWLGITMIAIATGILAAGISFLLSKVQAQMASLMLVYLFSFASALVAFFIRTAYMLWSQLFIFASYKKS